MGLLSCGNIFLLGILGGGMFCICFNLLATLMALVKVERWDITFVN